MTKRELKRIVSYEGMSEIQKIQREERHQRREERREKSLEISRENDQEESPPESVMTDMKKAWNKKHPVRRKKCG